MTSPRAYEIIVMGSDGTIAPGNDLITSTIKIHSIQAGYLLRVLNGNNKGTYTIASTTPDSGGSHAISVSNTLIENMPAIVFNPTNRNVIFQTALDISTVKAGDEFTDNSSTVFTIVSVDADNSSIVIDGVALPDISAGASISRVGDVFVSEPSLVRYLVMDPSKPIKVKGTDCDATSGFANVSPSIPLDIYYLIRIDSKERQTHIEILNRMWEEFNPPRTGLPVVVRTKASAETLLTVDVSSGGSQTINVKSNEDVNIGDTISIFDDLTPSKDVTSEGFQSLFTSTVTGKIGTDQLELADVVPDTFLVSNCTRVVTNADLQILMFHFVDHKTRDVESAQYWVHEFTFWVQAFVDRLGDITETGVITAVEIEDIELNTDC